MTLSAREVGIFIFYLFSFLQLKSTYFLDMSLGSCNLSGCFLCHRLVYLVFLFCTRPIESVYIRK